jgi:hypothetical protein
LFRSLEESIRSFSIPGPYALPISRKCRDYPRIGVVQADPVVSKFRKEHVGHTVLVVREAGHAMRSIESCTHSLHNQSHDIEKPMDMKKNGLSTTHKYSP